MTRPITHVENPQLCKACVARMPADDSDYCLTCSDLAITRTAPIPTRPLLLTALITTLCMFSFWAGYMTGLQGTIVKDRKESVARPVGGEIGPN